LLWNFNFLFCQQFALNSGFFMLVVPQINKVWSPSIISGLNARISSKTFCLMNFLILQRSWVDLTLLVFLQVTSLFSLHSLLITLFDLPSVDLNPAEKLWVRIKILARTDVTLEIRNPSSTWIRKITFRSSNEMWNYFILELWKGYEKVIPRGKITCISESASPCNL